MEGIKKQKKLSLLLKRKKDLKEKIREKKEEERKNRKEMDKISGKESELKRKRKKIIKKREPLDRRLKKLFEKDGEARGEKQKIEEKERKEEDPKRLREIEKKRWEKEDQKRKIEDMIWKTEDRVKELNEDIRRVERAITENIRPQKRELSIKEKELENILQQSKARFFMVRKAIKKAKREAARKEKELQRAKEKAKREKEARKKKEEERKRKEEKEKRKEKKRRRKEEEEKKMVEEIRRRAKKEEEERKRKEKEKGKKEAEEEEKKKREKERTRKHKEEEEREQEMKEKMDKLFEVIEGNKEEIASLKKELAEREEKHRENLEAVKSEKESEDKKPSNRDLEEEKKQIDLIKEKVKEEHDKLKEKEDALKKEEGSYQSPPPLRREREDEEEKKKQIDFVKEQVRAENERSKREEERKKSKPSQEEVIEEDSSSSLEEKVKLNREEAEVLFKRAEKTLHAGNLQGAKRRFERVKNEYTPDNQGSVFEREPLNERAQKYLEKIKKEEGEHEDTKQTKKEESTAKEEGTSESNSRPVIKEVVRERVREPDKKELKKEVEEIIREKQKLKEEQERLQKEKGERVEPFSKEKEEKKRELENEKQKLKEKEKRAGEEEREKIRRQMKEMEEELKKLIEEETSKKWEKRISGVEEKVENVQKRYDELTDKEKQLRGKIKKIDEWGPMLREKKKEKDAFAYRSIYNKPPQKGKKGLYSQEITEDVDEEGEEVEKEEEKAKENPLLRGMKWIRNIKPSKDFFLEKPLMVAIDISDFSIEVFCINEKRKATSFGRTVLEEGVVYNGDIRREDKLKEALLNTFEKADISLPGKEKKTNIKAVMSLPDSKIFIQQFKLGEEENVLEKIKEKLGKSIPVPIEDLFFHYHTTPFTSTKEEGVLCVAVQRSTVKRYMDFLKSLDIDPVVFDIEAVSLGRALLKEKEEENKKAKEKKKRKEDEETPQKGEKETKKTEMIVDLGARSTTISVFRDKLLLMSVSGPFGGAYFTDKIAKDLNISKEEAEKKKKEIGIKGEIKESIETSLKTVVKEIRDAENYYEKEFGEKVGEVVVIGGSALLPGILEYLKGELGEGVRIGDPREKVEGAENISKDKGVLFVNAIGLALRTVGKDPIESGFNMLPEEIKKKERRHQKERKRFVRSAATLFAVLGLLTLGYSLYYSFIASPQRVREVEERIEVEEEKEILTEVKEGHIAIKSEFGEEGAPLYNNPQKEEVVERVQPGEQYEVRREIGGWHLIEVREERGWISEEYIVD